MTQVLSFAEWVAQQDSNEVDYAQSECEQWTCALRDKPMCLEEDGFCPIKRLYEQQKAQDLKKWEKWNQPLESERNS